VPTIRQLKIVCLGGEGEKRKGVEGLHISFSPSPSLSHFQFTKIQLAFYKIENRRKFFEDYAKSNGFNPLVPTNWHLQTPNKIMSFKV
jgi:hypothetical protein